MYSRESPLRLAMAAMVTSSSGSMRTTCRSGTAVVTSLMALASAALKLAASRSNAPYWAPSRTPKRASSQQASYNASRCLSSSASP